MSRPALLALLSQGPAAMDSETTNGSDRSKLDFEQRWSAARSIADRESFLHWEVAFPGVWRRWQDARPEGGFDAVIGNPPWDRIKLQEVEWFATRAPALALHAHRPRPPGRRSSIAGLQRRRPTRRRLCSACTEPGRQCAGWSAQSSAHLSPARRWPYVNLYSLFVERAMSLIKPDGFVGLLTPSGIYADKTAANFFKSVSTSGRVAGLFDFENRKIFFKDIHASFKFCALDIRRRGPALRPDQVRLLPPRHPDDR